MKFSYPHTAARLLSSIAILVIINFRHISSLEDALIELGGAIVGSIAGEVAIRLIFKKIIQDWKIGQLIINHRGFIIEG